MKSILLASVAMVGFAGIAVAQDSETFETTDGVSFSGTATFGYNDTDWDGPRTVEVDKDGNEIPGTEEKNDEDDNVGFYWESDLELDLTRSLDNGLRAGVGFSIDLADDNEGDGQGGALTSSGFVLFLESDDAGIFLGDTSFAAEKYWPDADVDEMAGDGFSEQDGEFVLRGDVIDYGGVNASLSYVLADTNGVRPGTGSEVTKTTDKDGNITRTQTDTFGSGIDQLSLGASFEWGGYTFGVAYQDESDAANRKGSGDDVPGDGGSSDEPAVDGRYSAYDDFVTDQIFGIGAKANIAGFDGAIAYANNMTWEHTSLGILVNYPIGPIGARAYYVMEDGPLSCESTDVEDNPKTDKDEAQIAQNNAECGIDSWGLGFTYENGPVSLEAIYKETSGEVDSVLEGTYDVGNGFMVWAGLVSAGDDYYVAATQDLGGGAQLLVSYGVDDDSSEEDEIGNPEIQEGATVELTLAF